MNYKQEDTQKIIDEMRTASSRPANLSIATSLRKACDRMAEMECMIFRLVDEKNKLMTDNQMIADKLEETTQRLQEAMGRGKRFDYYALLSGFMESGKPSERILLDRHNRPSGTAWYSPQINRVRSVIDQLKLPVEAIQRTNSKNPDVTPVMYLFRTDCEE